MSNLNRLEAMIAAEEEGEGYAGYCCHEIESGLSGAVPALIAVARTSELALSASMRHGPVSPEAIRTAHELEDAHCALDDYISEMFDD